MYKTTVRPHDHLQCVELSQGRNGMIIKTDMYTLIGAACMFLVLDLLLGDF